MFEWTLMRKLIWLKAAVISGAAAAWETVTGAIVSFVTQRAAPLKELVANIEPVQSGSGDPSPDNVRPITGHTGVNVWVTGKNLIDKSKAFSGQNWVVFGGNLQAADGSLYLPAETYTLSFTQKGYIYIEDASGTRLATVVNATSQTFTNPKAQVVKISISNQTDFANNNYQLELGSTATTYEAYSGSSVSVSFDSAGTVYGGTLDVVSGEGEITKEALIFPSSSWSFSSDFFYKTFSEINGVATNGYYITENGVKMNLNGNNGQVRIYLGDNDFLNSSSDVGALLNGYKVVYTRRTARTFQTEPTPVNALSGQNNIWTDTGNVSVTYQSN